MGLICGFCDCKLNIFGVGLFVRQNDTFKGATLGFGKLWWDHFSPLNDALIFGETSRHIFCSPGVVCCRSQPLQVTSAAVESCLDSSSSTDRRERSDELFRLLHVTEQRRHTQLITSRFLSWFVCTSRLDVRSMKQSADWLQSVWRGWSSVSTHCSVNPNGLCLSCSSCSCPLLLVRAARRLPRCSAQRNSR